MEEKAGYKRNRFPHISIYMQPEDYCAIQEQLEIATKRMGKSKSKIIVSAIKAGLPIVCKDIEGMEELNDTEERKWSL